MGNLNGLRIQGWWLGFKKQPSGVKFGSYRSLTKYQYHFEVHLRYHIRYLYKAYGTIILEII